MVASLRSEELEESSEPFDALQTSRDCFDS